jgi:glucose-6-phosphate 1-dehydrogenase
VKESEKPKILLVIFGATGDLAKRKLYPAIYRLYKNGNLSESFAVVGISRRSFTDNQFRAEVERSITEEKPPPAFLDHFYYYPLDVTNQLHYENLKYFIDDIDAKHMIPGNRIFYLAMSPQLFGTIAQHIKNERITSDDGWNRLIIEKPFGENVRSAQRLNDDITKVFREDQIYRIDHYLGKEMVQNIEVIRFANAIFEPLWNNRYISISKLLQVKQSVWKIGANITINPVR